MSFYSQGFKATLTGSINALNSLPIALTEAMFNLSTPVASSGSDDANTTATLQATGVMDSQGESYGGAVEISYIRLDLSLLFKGIDLQWITQSTNTAKFANWVAATYDIPLTEADILAEVIPASSNRSYITIKANPDSLWVIGECLVYYSRGAQDIHDLLGDDWDTQAFTPLVTVDANYQQSYSTDYTGSGPLLRKTIAPMDISTQRAVWHVLFGGRDVQFDSQCIGVLYTGTASVVAAGGKPGFENLIIIPRLNAWAHFNS